MERVTLTTKVEEELQTLRSKETPSWRRLPTDRGDRAWGVWNRSSITRMPTTPSTRRD